MGSGTMTLYRNSGSGSSAARYHRMRRASDWQDEGSMSSANVISRSAKPSGRTIQSVNPATQEVLASFDLLTPAQLEAKLASAAAAFRDYRRVPFAQRAEWLLRAAGVLEAGKERFARM